MDAHTSLKLLKPFRMPFYCIVILHEAVDFQPTAQDRAASTKIYLIRAK